MMRARGMSKKRKHARKHMWVAIVCAIALISVFAPYIFHAVRADAASETAISNRSWDDVKSVIQQKIGTGYQEAGRCTGYVYWCLANAYGVDWGTNSPVEGLEAKLVNAGITKVAEGTSGMIESNMKPGDIVIFSEGSDGTHCAILGEGGVLYHARSSVGVVCSPTLKEWMSWPDADKNCDRYRVYRGLQSTGAVTITKTSADKGITDGNRCYSLAGAEYGMYQGETLIGTLTTDANGKASLENIPYGSYTLREISASPGYAVDLTTYDICVDSAVTAKTVTEQPQANPVAMMIHKTDREIHDGWSADNTAQFAASLENAHYQVNYYDGYYSETTDFSKMIPLRSWRVKTDASGQASLNDTQLVSGDPFYYSSDGQVVLPLGTVTVQEVKAPKGYVLDDAIHVRQVTSSGTAGVVDTYAVPVHQEQIIRGDIELIKVEGDSLGRLANVPFTLTSKSTGESHTLITDANGYASTAAGWNSHGAETNQDSETAGIWFGNMEQVNDSLGALPYDTYILDEQPCEANAGLTLIHGVEIVVYKHNVTVNLGTVTDDVIKIETSASDKATGKKESLAGDDFVLVDKLDYEGLACGREYVAEGTVYVKSTGKPLIVDGKQIESSVAFTPKDRTGSVEIPFHFDASALGGEALVVFERLYTDGTLAAVHEDINNTEQTVRISNPVVVEEVKCVGSFPETGDFFPWEVIVAINLILLSVIGICGVFIKKRRLTK